MGVQRWQYTSGGEKTEAGLDIFKNPVVDAKVKSEPRKRRAVKLREGS